MKTGRLHGWISILSAAREGWGRKTCLRGSSCRQRILMIGRGEVLGDMGFEPKASSPPDHQAHTSRHTIAYASTGRISGSLSRRASYAFEWRVRESQRSASHDCRNCDRDDRLCGNHVGIAAELLPCGGCDAPTAASTHGRSQCERDDLRISPLRTIGSSRQRKNLGTSEAVSSPLRLRCSWAASTCASGASLAPV